MGLQRFTAADTAAATILRSESTRKGLRVMIGTVKISLCLITVFSIIAFSYDAIPAEPSAQTTTR